MEPVGATLAVARIRDAAALGTLADAGRDKPVPYDRVPRTSALRPRVGDSMEQAAGATLTPPPGCAVDRETRGMALPHRAAASPAPTGSRCFSLGILFGLLVASMGGFGAHGDEDARELERLLGSMSSYRADFEQAVAGQYGEILQTSTGTIHLERPRKLRWQVDEPYPQLVVADGDHVWVFDPDLEQVTVHRFDETVAGTPAMFLTDTALLDENFLVGTADAVDGSDRRFTLAPRDPDSSSLFRTVTLAFSGQGLLTGLEIVDHLEQRTQMSFRNGELNPVLESELFQFDVPEGVDVIGNLPDDVPAESTP